MEYRSRYRETIDRKGESFGASDSAEQGLNADLGTVDRELVDFKRCVDGVGTPLNNEENRKEVRRLRSVIKRRLGDAKTKVQEQQRGTPQQRVEAKQLSKQLNNYVQQFDGLLSQERNLTQQHQAQISGSVTVDSPDGAAAPMIRYQQQISVSDVQSKEQDAVELVELEKDILDLHDIQKDLAGMVHDQGEEVGHIETHVAKAAVRVEKGKNRLEDAVVLTSKNRRLKVCICLSVTIPIVIIMIVIIIVLAVVLPKQNN